MSCGTVANQGFDRAAIEKELTQMELDWMDAALKGNVDLIRRVAADDFVHTYNDESENKSHMIENWSLVIAGSGASDNIKVNVLGPDVAVVTGRESSVPAQK